MGKINYRTDDINKKLKQIDELVGSNKNLSNQINNFNSQLEHNIRRIDKDIKSNTNTKNLFIVANNLDSTGANDVTDELQNLLNSQWY